MQGVIAAIPTPLDGDEKFDMPLFLEHAEWALENGCDGLNVLGSTGEASSFSLNERKHIMECAAKHLPLTRLMVGTGTPSLAETIELTSFAAQLGFPIALVLPPYYYKPISDSGLERWFARLDHELGTSPLQIYFYNYPQMTGFQFPVEFIAHLNNKAPHRFAGVKDSSGDLEYCAQLVSAAPGLKVFPSSETALAKGKSNGFAGCISATANITAPICQRVWKAGENAQPDDIAALENQRAAITALPLIPAIKYLVGQQRNNPGMEAVLPPFQPLNSDQRVSLDAKFS